MPKNKPSIPLLSHSYTCNDIMNGFYPHYTHMITFIDGFSHQNHEASRLHSRCPLRTARAHWSTRPPVAGSDPSNSGDPLRRPPEKGTKTGYNIWYVTGQDIFLLTVILVGGSNPSEKILVSWEYYSQYMENKKKKFQTTNQYNIISVMLLDIEC